MTSTVLISKEKTFLMFDQKLPNLSMQPFSLMDDLAFNKTGSFLHALLLSRSGTFNICCQRGVSGRPAREGARAVAPLLCKILSYTAISISFPIYPKDSPLYLPARKFSFEEEFCN